MLVLRMMAIVAGLFFGAWPLLMNRSGLSGYLSAFVFAALALMTVTPFAFSQGFSGLKSSSPFLYLGAGMAGGVGVIIFNSVLSQASYKDVGSLFLVMIMAQITVPSIYNMVENGVEPKKLAGIAAAVIATILLG